MCDSCIASNRACCTTLEPWTGDALKGIQWYCYDLGTSRAANDVHGWTQESEGGTQFPKHHVSNPAWELCTSTRTISSGLCPTFTAVRRQWSCSHGMCQWLSCALMSSLPWWPWTQYKYIHTRHARNFLDLMTCHDCYTLHLLMIPSRQGLWCSEQLFCVCDAHVEGSIVVVDLEMQEYHSLLPGCQILCLLASLRRLNFEFCKLSSY